MVRIRDAARISPFQKVDNSMKVKPLAQGNYRNPGFKKWMEDRHSEQLNLQDIILVALEEIQQPVSILEVQHYLKAEGSIDIPTHRVKYALEQLAMSGRAAAHLESIEERALRFNGSSSPKRGFLFNSGETPRKRTIANAIPGYKIYDSVERREAAKKRKPRSSTVVVPSSSSSTSVSQNSEAIDYLIEKIVEERTRELRIKLDEANAKLEQFKKLLT
jgi:hypothetical protein